MSLAGFELELVRPWFLMGLLGLPVLVFYFRQSLVDFAKRQRWASLLVRSLVLILLVLAMAGLTLLAPSREQFVVFALDRSVSIDENARREADAFVRDAIAQSGSHRVGVMTFGVEPGLVHARLADTADDQLDGQGTDLESALLMARAAIPPSYVPKVVLLSDGNETTGDVLRSVLGLDACPVSCVPLPVRQDPEVQVSAVVVPAEVRQGEPFYVEVVVDSNHEGEGLVEVFRGPHRVVSEKKKLSKGENRFRFRQSTKESLTQFTARTRDFQDTLLDNNSDTGLVFAAGKPRVLLVESEAKLARNLQWALQEEDIQVDVRPPEGMPDTLAEIQNYQLVILSNVPATALRLTQMEIARTYVQELGGGLIMIGGDQSFGLGGYYKTILEEILPVRSDFEKEKEKPSLAMVLVIDKSGSMGGQKIELAKDAAKSAVELLGPSDRIGVLAFDARPNWVSDIHPCSDKQFVLDRIGGLQAGGGTAMHPAMDEAYRALDRTVAKLKHVIILSDGISAPGDFLGVAQIMAANRITVSTVGLGKNADQKLLEELARVGGGRAYFTDDPSTIPQIFAKETVAASKSAINEQPFLPQVVRRTQALSGIDLEAAPFLLGYVVTRAKPTSEVILTAENGDPLLAWWRYGLGFASAFTSDAKPRWAAEWVSWAGFSKFWAQITRHTMRKSDSLGVHVQVTRRGGRARVVLDAVEPTGRFLNGADSKLTVIDPDMKRQELALDQVAPGRYVGELSTEKPGAYHLELSQTRQGRSLFRQSRGMVVGYPDELRLRPQNEDLLRQVAALTGGRFAPGAENVFEPTERTARRATDLWTWLLSTALGLFLLDVALRRVDWSFGRSRARAPRQVASTTQ